MVLTSASIVNPQRSYKRLSQLPQYHQWYPLFRDLRPPRLRSLSPSPRLRLVRRVCASMCVHCSRLDCDKVEGPCLASPSCAACCRASAKRIAKSASAFASCAACCRALKLAKTTIALSIVAVACRANCLLSFPSSATVAALQLLGGVHGLPLHLRPQQTQCLLQKMQHSAVARVSCPHVLQNIDSSCNDHLVDIGG